MGENWSLFLVGFAAIWVLVLAIIALAFTLMSGLFARTGGWGNLARHYAVTEEPSDGIRLTAQTVQVGYVRYRFSTTVRISTQGLYLKPFLLPAHAALLIPWSAFTMVEERRLYWLSARRLTVGRPPIAQITVWLSLFERIKPYLAPELVPLGA